MVGDMAIIVWLDTVTQALPPSAAGRGVDTRSWIGYNRPNCSPPSGSSGLNWRGLSIAGEPVNTGTKGHNG